eukprot:g8258.t1
MRTLCQISTTRNLSLHYHSDAKRNRPICKLHDTGRRSIVFTFLASTIAVYPGRSHAADDLETFYGKATPPTSYGGYGGTAEEAPKYSFMYPANWKFQPVNKVQKGTQGIDARVVNPRNRNMAAFAIVLSRAGEDDKSYKVTDVEGTFQGFAGADYDIQDALMSATSTKKSERTVENAQYYDYEVDSPVAHYLATVTIKEGKVFAFFVKSPSKEFSENENTLRSVLTSFKTI